MQCDGTLKKTLTSNWEEIEVKPPIDMIPDEFERENNEKFLVEIVNESDDIEATEFASYLKELQFEVSNTDLNDSDMSKTVNSEWLEKVKDKIDKGDYQGILMVFAKVSFGVRELRNIWKEFTSSKCPKLKNKPKIFIFQMMPVTKVKRDSTAAQLNWKLSYETPSEADVLIILDQYDKQREGVLHQLMSTINQYGDKEDIFTLTTLNQDDYNYQPLLVSTMTRKFYFKPHHHRGYHLDIRKSLQMIETRVVKMQEKNEPKNEAGKVKKSDSFMSKIRMSFKTRKSPEKKSEGAGAAGSSRSTVTVPDKSRSRRTSTRTSNASDKDAIKPAWKP